MDFSVVGLDSNSTTSCAMDTDTTGSGKTAAREAAGNQGSMNSVSVTVRRGSNVAQKDLR
jgi:hypothetical protein